MSVFIKGNDLSFEVNEEGFVVNPKMTGGIVILRFNVKEFNEFYGEGRFEKQQSVDILDIGYWYSGDWFFSDDEKILNYEPPELDYRNQLILQQEQVKAANQKITREEFFSAIIAQDDDNDYQEDGYVICVFGNIAKIGKYGHCSCYGTFEALCGGGISDSFAEGTPSWDWSGSLDELKIMATECRDPAMPQRKANEEDFDYDHLCAAYAQVIEWFNKRENKI